MFVCLSASIRGIVCVYTCRLLCLIMCDAIRQVLKSATETREAEGERC